MRRTLGAMAAIILASGCGGGDKAGAPIPAEGVIALSEQFSGDFALIDQSGRPTTDEDFRGRVSFIYFGFATCPDVCPLALGRMSAALNLLDEKELQAVAPLFITVDPDRDTPEKIAAYLAFDRRITGLTGDAAAAARARDSFKVYAKPQTLANSAAGYTMDHTSLFYIVDRGGRPTLALKDSLTPEELASVLRRSIKTR